MANESIEVWRIDPLPDFLVDHTLAGEAEPERLKEHAARWVQLIGSVWEWRDRATFGLRYIARAGRISACFLATPHRRADGPRLVSEMDVLLRAHRLISDPARERVPAAEFEQLSELQRPVFVEVAQYSTRALWRMPAHFQNNEQFKGRYPWLPTAEWNEPLVIYPWWGPGGPFLLPMESLLSQSVAVSLTILLAPTELRSHEWEWLALMAREAQSKGEQNLQQIGSGASVRTVDPSANLAGRLYMANLRRLSATPFLVAAQCAAEDGRIDVARSVAGALQSLVHEPPFERPQQEEQRLPSGAALRGDVPERTSASFSALALHQYREARLLWPQNAEPLARMPYLADAQGAATIFRLPVSVRGGVPGMRVKQLPPDFHPGARESRRPPDQLQLGHYHAGGGAFLPVRDLCKHALITGFTGSGKTVTVMQILHQLWVDHQVPFLVLESAKQEYRGLITVEAMQTRQPALRVYTLGNELVAPFRLNPFELLPGVRVEAHVSRLQACIEAAIPPIGPSASIISEALLRAYEQCGWSLTDCYPLQGVARRRFPVLSDFVRTVEQVLTDRAYEGEVKSNLQAALVGRFKPLLLGGKGRMFDTQRSAPGPCELFAGPVVLEMNDLNLDDKALVVMFLLTLLREHRELNRSQHGELKHVTMVEEAHNVLEEVSSQGGGEGATSADTRYKAVQAFCAMLTEIRSLGEGLIIADQSPEKLARDALRNTNVQIAHQLRDGHDRDAIANAMIMEDEQRDYVGKLPPGQAALFRTGLEKATFICVEKYSPGSDDFQAAPTRADTAAFTAWKRRFRGYGFNPLLADADLARYMEQADPALLQRRRLVVPYPECDLCRSQCRFRDAVFPEASTESARRHGAHWLKLTDRVYREQAGVSFEQMWRRAVDLAAAALSAANISCMADAVWCHFTHLWDFATRDAGLDRQSADHQLGARERDELEAALRRMGVPSASVKSLVVWSGDRQVAAHALAGRPIVIGSSASAQVRIPQVEGVPEIVAVVSETGGAVHLENRVSGARRSLPVGARIQVRPFVLEVRESAPVTKRR